jgi:hypothetical protein
MNIKLDQKNKKTLKLGIIGIVVILLAMFFLDWIQNWKDLRQSIKDTKKQLEVLAAADERMETLRTKVPAVAIPQKETKQLFTFRDALNRQLNQARITVQPFKVSTVAKSARPEYQYLYLQCSGNATFENVLNFLADLKTNPYLVGIDEFVISKPATPASSTTRGNTPATMSNMPYMGSMPGMGGMMMGGPGGMPDYSAMAAAFSGGMQNPSQNQQGQQRQSNVVNIELKVSTFVKR